VAVNRIIQVFEHQPLKLNQKIGDIEFDEKCLTALEKFHGDEETKKFPYYSLINKGVKFKEYVGVLQVGNLTIEILPKTDRLKDDANDLEKKENWHGFLINMLKTVGVLDVKSTGFSSLKLKGNSILKLYFEYFIKETSYLLRTGLVKKYRKTSGNSFALKGGLIFGKNIQHNLTHAERFYVRYTSYDQNNIFNRILYKTIKLLAKINSSSALASDIQNLLLNFPEVPDMAVNDMTFDRLVYDRKTESYRKAINIARLILLNYHPDIRKGSNDVLALMFDMNKLWEKYMLKILNRDLKADGDEYAATGQIKTPFWQPDKGNVMKIIPDIVVIEKQTQEPVVILDTKWKNLKTDRPADDDIKQMLSYNLYNINDIGLVKRSALVYPTSVERDIITGAFSLKDHGTTSLVFVKLDKDNGVIKPNLEQLIEFIKKEVPIEQKIA
jgi:5-methylcytosine-specific restriction enzyme subunit McrC